jgi:formylglycine-generating enzyme required for sulfatase activity
MPRADVVTYERGDGARPEPAAVGTAALDVTPLGIHDLGGSVAEWVDGGADASEEILDLSGGEAVGALASEARRRIRGGTWTSVGPCHLLGSRCRAIPPVSYHDDVGFRCARSVVAAARQEPGR